MSSTRHTLFSADDDDDARGPAASSSSTPHNLDPGYVPAAARYSRPLRPLTVRSNATPDFSAQDNDALLTPSPFGPFPDIDPPHAPSAPPGVDRSYLYDDARGPQSVAARQQLLRGGGRNVSPMALEKGEADDETLVDSDTTPDEKAPPAPILPAPGVASSGEETPLASFLNSEPFWLLLYFTFNLVLTLYNKIVLVKFPFPYTLTALHALCGTIGAGALLRMGMFTPASLTDRENVALVAFSVLYTVNIAVSNISLQLVTVPFHQVVRAATPLFIILFNLLLFGTGSSKMKFASLIPVIAGVGFATYGDYYATPTGLLLTLLGTVLAALKTIYTSILQSRPPTTPAPGAETGPSLAGSVRAWLIPPRLALHPLDLLCRMAPLAFAQCVILAQLTGELGRVHAWSSVEMDFARAASLLCNGAIAFGLNIVSFTANRKVGPLSITVAANVKQVLSIFLAVAIFDLVISPTNGCGIFLTLAGGGWYAVVDFREKRRRRAGAGAR